MRILTGVSAAPGIVMGKAFLYLEDFVIPRRTIPPEQGEDEMRRFIAAVEEVAEELRSQQEKAVSKEQAGIFGAHRMMVEDADFHYKVKVRFETNYENIEWGVSEVSRELARKLMESSSEYLRERTQDVIDVSRRIIRRLLGVKNFSLADVREDLILVARNLLPSEVLAMNKYRVKAVLLDAGSRTNHTAIFLRSFAIPTVLGLGSVTTEVTNGSDIIVDGEAGRLFIDPDSATIKQYNDRIVDRDYSFGFLSALKGFPAETTDGRMISLKANIGIPEEADDAARYDAEGIGLFRSEFLFLQQERNSEEAQLAAYSRVVTAMKGKPVTIRTVDLGGDRALPAMESAREKNPLMGWRAIRFSLDLPDFFKTQLRAILRAGADKNVNLMFPMISGIEELEAALGYLEEARAECRKKNQDIAEEINTGIMIEIPSAVLTADILAKKANFFSIGTNDLVQYTVAADRENTKVSHLARGTHPAVLRLIKQTIDIAHSTGIKAAMCGEMAGDTAAAALLLGMGLDEWSMNAASIPRVKQLIRSVNYSSCKTLAEQALGSSSCKQVQELIRNWHKEHVPNLTLASDLIPETVTETTN